MTSRATASFVIDTFENESYDETGGVTAGNTTLTKTFSGDVEGTSTVRMLGVRTPVEGSAGYVAIEHLTVAVHGRKGGFVLQHWGINDHGSLDGRWAIVPDSGIGDLAGLRGTAAIDRHADGSHTFTLDYTLG